VPSPLSIVNEGCSRVGHDVGQRRAAPARDSEAPRERRDNAACHDVRLTVARHSDY
jgi:hypothetical protein